MAKIIQGDEIIQDFTNSQRPEDVRVEELEEIAGRPTVQNFITELQEIAKKGPEENYGFNQMLGVLNSPKDENLRNTIKKVAEEVRKAVPEIEYVIHCGIGGSELGATMVIKALGKSNAEYIPITSLNNDHISKIQSRIKPEKSILIKSTRSNKTKETLTAFEVFRQKFESGYIDYRRHCVAIVDKRLKDDESVKKECQHFIPVEGEMSGRYSALHAANLFTMHLMGADIDGLHDGALHMLNRCTQGRTIADNPALEVAVYNYLMNTTRGKVVFNQGIFSPDLVKYGDWLGQLVEESLGHRSDIAIATKTSELSNKAHSYFQGWLEGANNTYHQFVFPLGNKEKEVIADKKTGETLRDIEFAEFKGISTALANKGIPNYTTFLKEINEKALGQLIMRDLVATMFLGQLYGLRNECIDGKVKEFGYLNQPGVEAYKVIMHGILSDIPKVHDEISKLEKMFI